MHLAVFYQYYHNPDCAATGRHYAFFNQWVARHRITLITTRTWLDRRLTTRFAWTPPGVDVHLLDVPYDNAMRPRQRLGAFARYALKAVLKGRAGPRPDLILGVSTPLTAAWAAATVARRRRIPWVFEVKDLWPDFPIQMGAVRHRWMQRRLYALERRLYHDASHTVTLSPDMTTHLLDHGVAPEKVTTLVNGTDFGLLDACTDEDVAALRAAHGLTGKTVVLYGGTLGRANDVPTLMEAARRLQHRADIQFVVIGHGYLAARVQEAAGRLANLTALPAQPRHRMLAWFKLADISLVSFIDRPVLAANSPAKFFDSLGAGTPVIVTNPGWTQAFVERHGCGWYTPPSDPAALARRLETVLATPDVVALAGRRGADVAREQFDRDRLAAQMEQVFEEVVARATR